VKYTNTAKYNGNICFVRFMLVYYLTHGNKANTYFTMGINVT